MERLQKYMAGCGVASRRKCEEFIAKGLVSVNGNIVTEPGVKVDPLNDTVIYNGKTIKPVENKIYIALNKPKGYITSVSDERNRKTVIDLLNLNERVFPIGRLDYNTTGLLLLTNDGDIYNSVIHPRVKINKVYEAVVKGCFTEEEMRKFRTGVDIGDYITSDADIKILNNYNNTSRVRITIHEGKNRQVRRMCSAFGHDVIELKRVSVGKIVLGNLGLGKWRNLTDKEIEYLSNLNK